MLAIERNDSKRKTSVVTDNSKQKIAKSSKKKEDDVLTQEKYNNLKKEKKKFKRRCKSLKKKKDDYKYDSLKYQGDLENALKELAKVKAEKEKLAETNFSLDSLLKQQHKKIKILKLEIKDLNSNLTNLEIKKLGVEGSCMVEKLEINSSIFELNEAIKDDKILDGGINALEIQPNKIESFDVACENVVEVNSRVHVTNNFQKLMFNFSKLSLIDQTIVGFPTKQSISSLNMNGMNQESILIVMNIPLFKCKNGTSQWILIRKKSENCFIVSGGSIVDKRFIKCCQVQCISRSNFSFTKDMDYLLEKVENLNFEKKKRKFGSNYHVFGESNVNQLMEISNCVDSKELTNIHFKKRLMIENKRKESPMIDNRKENGKKVKMTETKKAKSLSSIGQKKEEDYFTFTLLMLIVFGIPFILIFLIFHFAINSINFGKLKKKFQQKKKNSKPKHEIVLYPWKKNNLKKYKIMQIDGNEEKLMLLMMQIYVHFGQVHKKEKRQLLISLEKDQKSTKKEAMFCIEMIFMQIKN